MRSKFAQRWFQGGWKALNENDRHMRFETQHCSKGSSADVYGSLQARNQRGALWAFAAPPPEILTHYMAILTFAETFKVVPRLNKHSDVIELNFIKNCSPEIKNWLRSWVTPYQWCAVCNAFLCFEASNRCNRFLHVFLKRNTEAIYV